MIRQFFLGLFVLLLFSANGYAQCTAGDCESGYGTYKYSDGSVYVGEFKDSKADGYGTCYYVNGDKFVGYWKNHKAEGQGTMYYKDGRVTTGTWKESQLVTEDGSKTGCINGDCLNGTGTYVYDNGTKYTGSFKNGGIDGYGTCDFYNGDKYVGNWEDNQMTGEGTYTYAGGKVESGMWKDNNYIGPIKGSTGCISGDCDNGYGTYVYSDGSKYTGNFKDGKANGSGTCDYANGNKFIGQFANHTFNGYGTMYYKDGRVETGDWKDGALVSNIYDKPTDTKGDKGTTDNSANSNSKNNNNTSSSANTKTGDKTSNTGTPKVWAVVVGVATYQMPQLKLNYPDDDAYRLYSFLMSPQGGALPDNQVALLIDEDATKDKIVNSLKTIFSEAGPNDVVLFYFAGHGMKGAFIPYDYDGATNVLYHTEVSDLLKNCKAKNKVCIADACHSGTLTARGRDLDADMSAAGETFTSYYKALAASSGGLALIMSSQAEETSMEFGMLRQGAFSYFLIKGLKGEADSDGNKIVTVTELFTYVQKKVEDATSNQQNPVISGNYDKNMPLGVVRY